MQLRMHINNYNETFKKTEACIPQTTKIYGQAYEFLELNKYISTVWKFIQEKKK